MNEPGTPANHEAAVCAPASACCGPTPSTPPSRREVVALSGLGLAWLAGRRSGVGAVAGPFTQRDVGDHGIPADKKLDPAWVRSLFERGEPAWYRSDRGELDLIGMPVGGIGCGQLYLGGDGKLWLWDLFNLPAPGDFRSGQGPHYAEPLKQRSPIEQGFAIRAKGLGTDEVRRLDASGWSDVLFRGEYPVGRVTYYEPAAPVSVELEAFSPFIPPGEDDSSLPVTVMAFTVRNDSPDVLEVTLGGWLENPSCLASGQPGRGARINRVVDGTGWKALVGGAGPDPNPLVRHRRSQRPDLPFDDFESGVYEGWTATGTAFGERPRELSDVAGYQGDLNAQGSWTVNSHETRSGEDVRAGDAHTGALESREFTLERDYVRFRIGGGNHPGETCLQLVVDGEVVRSATGHDGNRMRQDAFDVRELEGRTARLRIVDTVEGPWGNIGVDEIVQSDAPWTKPLEEEADFGTMALCALDPAAAVVPGLADGVDLADRSELARRACEDPVGLAFGTSRSFGQRLVGTVSSSFRLKPNESRTVTFLIAWHFPGLWWDSLSFLPGIRQRRRHYAQDFGTVEDVVQYVAANFERLAGATRLWRDTWYASSLPYWLLDRTFANLSTLATSTCYRFDDGRFYGWEGTYCCAGTCTHVWQYAQGVARVFPGLERWLREHVDYGMAFHEDTGAIDYRAEAARSVAHDGQAGTIVRAWREHTMAPDGAFLRRRWPRIKRSLEYLIAEDENDDGVLEGGQYNTLDATWYGPMGWLSSLYLAAVRAGQAMAEEMGDAAFAARCRAIVERGSDEIVTRLFDGEYFVHLPDPEHPEANQTGAGCHIDQVLGQSHAFQVGLGRVLPREQTVSALRSLWRYSFTPDIGPYRKRMEEVLRGGRWYAMPGEGGLVMCTFPKGGAEEATGKGNEAWAAGYFNECMTGFEYQVAGHMLWEGLALEGLAIARTIHDRYHPKRRNPYNEVECSDHYARAMASYGVHVAACGFEHHGPKGHLGFAPRLRPEDFSAAFVGPEGFGMLAQVIEDDGLTATVTVRHGRLRLASLSLELPEGRRARSVRVRAASTRPRDVESSFDLSGRRLVVRLEREQMLRPASDVESLLVEVELQ